MRVLVTGATGFIGGKIVTALRTRGNEVWSLSRNPSPTLEQQQARVLLGDVTQAESLRAIPRDLDAIIHCAGLLGKWGTPEAVMSAVNVDGSIHLVNQIAGGQGIKFVHLSAGGVSGPVRERMVDETYVCRPATPYERTKYEAEQRILAATRGTTVQPVIVRPTFTYGPGDPHKLGLFTTVKKGRFAFIGNGESVNHPVYIDDLVAGLLLALDQGQSGERYIVGGERPVTKRELVYAIADALEVRRPQAAIPRPVAEAAALVFELFGRVLGMEPILTRSRVMMMGDNFGYSIAKARSQLGYAPQVDLDEGIRRTVAYYRAQGAL